MFTKRTGGGDDASRAADSPQDTVPRQPIPPSAPPQAAAPVGSGTPPMPPRPAPAPAPAAAQRRMPEPAPASNTGYRAPMSSSAVMEQGKLIVGRDIQLNGEIKNCNLLVVEGTVECTLTDTSALEVAEHGIYRGTAPVKSAEIAGLVEGDLIVEGHVFIRSTGVVNGNVEFGEIEIERGGQVRGSMSLYGQSGKK